MSVTLREDPGMLRARKGVFARMRVCVCMCMCVCVCLSVCVFVSKCGLNRCMYTQISIKNYTMHESLFFEVIEGYMRSQNWFNLDA